VETKAIVAFRYDDYHARLGTRDEPKDEIERRFLGIFAEHQVPLTLGVVPKYANQFPLAEDPGKLELLRAHLASGRMEAALHGFTHQSFAAPGARNSEFTGTPPEQQAERLRAGKAMLEDWLGTSVVSFIPPWNTYDEATVAALTGLGFSTLSADLSQAPVPEPPVALPHTCGFRELRGTLRWLTRRPGLGVVVCMFHHFSFTESPYDSARTYGRTTLAGLGDLLAWCRGQAGVELKTLGDAAERVRELFRDGRVDAARERWRLVFSWRRMPLVGRVFRWLWAPRALVEPEAWARGNQLLRLFQRLGGPPARGPHAG